MPERSTSVYRSARFGSVLWSVRSSGFDHRLSPLLQNPDGALGRAILLKDSDACTVGLVDGLVIKRWRPRGWVQALKMLGRGPQAERAGRMALALESVGVRTACPLAWGVAESGLPPKPNYLVTEEIVGEADLVALDGGRVGRFAAIGRLVGSLHHAGFAHRDLKPSNIRLLPNGEACLIDLDGVSRVAALSQARAVGDLVKLGRRVVELARLRPVDSARLVSAYCDVRGIRKRRSWWQALKTEALRHEEFAPLAHARWLRVRKETGRQNS
ncbi:MAG: hypothetical protein KF814_14905 [Nitrospiraceae bacterium]|nr:hypothetical protein [Nitrospiraceae bacterium]